VVRRAEKKLAAFGVKDVLPVLFRCTREELLQLGALADAPAFDRYRRERADVELRWKIINERFIEKEEEKNGIS
jgi:hypothetical protein